MVPGMFMRSIRGEKGKITVPGLGAVVGEFQSWNLMRREGNGPPVWTLHAVFRYQNDTLLKSDLTSRILLQLNKDTKIELCGWESMEVEGARLIVEGVIQCPT